MSPYNILALAEAAGISTCWTDAHGQLRQVSETALVGILASLDLPCVSEEQCLDSQARLDLWQGTGALPPLLTATAGQPITLPLDARVRNHAYRIEFEGGGSFAGHLPNDGALPLTLKAIDLCGYHRLFIGQQTLILAVAPTRCFGVADAKPGKTKGRGAYLWGLVVQLYSLRRQGDGGLGDFSTLASLACDAAKNGAAALAISPIHAMFSADPSRYSPYSPSSRLFLNAMYIDPGVAMSDEPPPPPSLTLLELYQRLEHEPLIDWPAAAGARLAALRRSYARFLARGAPIEFDQFCANGGMALQDHATYEALQEWLPWHNALDALAQQQAQGDWRRWPPEYRDPRGLAVAAFARGHRQQIGFHLFLQWHAKRGLMAAQHAARAAGMPIGLITDLAIGADRGGSQAWGQQAEILHGVSVGAPPDLLNVVGQNWGLCAYSPWRLRASGFQAYIEMLRACFANTGGVRIDHVLGLARLWLVPDGAGATDGAFVRYPMQDMLRLIALESWRSRTVMIGENLGTVPPGFDQQLAQANLLGISVLWFQREQLRFLPAQSWPDAAMATTSTHDLPTVAGWWSGNDIGWRAQLGLLEPGHTQADADELREQERAELWLALNESACASGEIPAATSTEAPIEAVLAFVGSTPAPLVLIPMEDLLGANEQPNFPGTIDSHPNWRRRFTVDVEHLLFQPEVLARLARLKKARAALAQKSSPKVERRTKDRS